MLHLLPPRGNTCRLLEVTLVDSGGNNFTQFLKTLSFSIEILKTFTRKVGTFQKGTFSDALLVIDLYECQANGIYPSVIRRSREGMSIMPRCNWRRPSRCNWFRQRETSRRLSLSSSAMRVIRI